MKKASIRKQIKSNTERKLNEKKKGKIKDDNIDLGKFFELASSEKKFVTGLFLHKIKSEILLNYTGVFEFNGSTVIEPVENKTNVRFRNRKDFEKYMNA